MWGNIDLTRLVNLENRYGLAWKQKVKDSRSLVSVDVICD